MNYIPLYFPQPNLSVRWPPYPGDRLLTLSQYRQVARIDDDDSNMDISSAESSGPSTPSPTETAFSIRPRKTRKRRSFHDPDVDSLNFKAKRQQCLEIETQDPCFSMILKLLARLSWESFYRRHPLKGQLHGD